MRNLIVLISSGHPNEVESARSSQRTFAQFGYELLTIVLAHPQATTVLNGLLRDRQQDIFCFMSANYYATHVTGPGGQLLHQFTGIPLVIMMHDHPVLFLPQQTPQLNGTIAFVPGEGSRRFVEAHYPIQTLPIANTGSLPQIAAETPDFQQFKERANAILAPMNLNFGTVTVDAAWQQIKALPAARRAFATALAEAALIDVATPLHEIAAKLPVQLPPEEAQAGVADQLAVLMFVKLWRRLQMVRALIDLPILISSEYVPADLEVRYPKKFTLFSMAQTIPMYRQYRFTLNAHPMLTHLLHDRILTAGALNSVCITDVNAAVERFFHDGLDAIFFDYAASREMPERIASYLDDPARAFELTVRAAAVRVVSEDFGYREGYLKLLDTVAEHWAPEPRVPLPART